MKKKTRLVILLAASFTLPVATLMIASRAGEAGAASARPQGPCDIYGAANTPCVTAHSSVRALYSSYKGALYQVMRQSDGKTLDIPVAADGYVDAAVQDGFCVNTLCSITTIYDQSPKGNHLYPAPPGTFKGPDKGAFNTLPIADMAPITINGKKAYGVYIMPGMGFRQNNASGLAINDEPEGMYSVVNGKHYSSGCCFDYGNAAPNGAAVGTGTMETTYFGNATAWGTGNGPGPWIEADFEAGVFSGYNAKKNDVPSIDSWQFVTAVVNGGGGNKWDLRGGDAQKGELTTYYSGVRPGSRENNAYFPMSKKGAVLMGNGGDNGNGSAGTFYEGAMTVGYPTDAAINAIQANIVAAKYDVPKLSLSRAVSFTPQSTQEVTLTFTNTTGAQLAGVELKITLPEGWTAISTKFPADVKENLIPGASKTETFKITSPANASAGFMTAKAQLPGGSISETLSQRVRSAFPVKINEVRLSNQFIELYNASDKEVDLSNWTLINTQSQWAPVKLATIPNGTKIAPKSYYLMGQSPAGLVAPSLKGDSTILVSNTTGFEAGQEITIAGEGRKITAVGSAASPVSTVFIPISTGPWINFPVGTTNLPATSAAGFVVGQKIGIDLGGNYEIATVTAVGKSATQTALTAPAVKGETRVMLASTANLSAGDELTIGTGERKEVVKIKSVKAGAAPAPAAGRRGGMNAGTPGEVELAQPLQFNNMNGVDVSSPGTGITISPATKFAHKSGDALQALGSGLTLDKPLDNPAEYGAPVVNPKATSAGYTGEPAPKQWFGGALSATAGSIALMDPSGKVVVDAIVFGSQQSSSSANGTIASPDLATLEGEQKQGGCIAIAPSAGRGGAPRGGAAGGAPAGPGRSMARVTDGADADNLCKDFQQQTPTPGAANQKPQ